MERFHSAFEKELFREGVFKFETPEVYLEGLDEYRRSSIKRMNLLPWLEYFNGKIPSRWEKYWGNITDDFERAKKVGVQLSYSLIEAGIYHPHWIVVDTVGKNQKLTPEQLAIVLEVSPAQWFKEDIIKAQRKNGLTEENINKAAYIFLMRGNYGQRSLPYRLPSRSSVRKTNE